MIPRWTRKILPERLCTKVRTLSANPPVGSLHFGDLRRLTPLSRDRGLNHRLPIDRYYVEKFLHEFRDDIRGRTLEFGERTDSELDETYDCILCIQALQFIYDLKGAVSNLYELLKPGGTLLLTVPGITYPQGKSWYWTFTRYSAQKLIQNWFEESKIQICTFGNVLAAVSLLHGLGADDLTTPELDTIDPEYEVLIAVRAVK